MKKTNENNKLNFLAIFIENTVFAMVLWPLLNYFFQVVIYKKEFTYSPIEYIFGPIVYGLFYACFTTTKKVIKKKINK